MLRAERLVGVMQVRCCCACCSRCACWGRGKEGNAVGGTWWTRALGPSAYARCAAHLAQRSSLENGEQPITARWRHTLSHLPCSPGKSTSLRHTLRTRSCLPRQTTLSVWRCWTGESSPRSFMSPSCFTFIYVPRLQQLLRVPVHLPRAGCKSPPSVPFACLHMEPSLCRFCCRSLFEGNLTKAVWAFANHWAQVSVTGSKEPNTPPSIDCMVHCSQSRCQHQPSSLPHACSPCAGVVGHGRMAGPGVRSQCAWGAGSPCSTHCTAIECMPFRNHKALGVGGCRAGRSCGCCRPVKTAEQRTTESPHLDNNFE